MTRAAVAALAFAAACTATPAARPSPSPSSTLSLPTPTEPPCAAAPTKRGWPAEVPADFPWPGGRVVKVDRESYNDVLTVRVEAPTSLREAVLFLVRRLPEAGYTLGRGDSEATEADAPFTKGEDLRGLVRVFATDDRCQTLWLLALVKRGASYSPPPS